MPTSTVAITGNGKHGMRQLPLTPEQSKIALLQLPDEIDAPANVWFDRLLAADNFLAAREMRDGGHAFANELQRDGRISPAEANLIRLTFDNQWYKRIDALDARQNGVNHGGLG
ncbi:hypothetical protein LN429_15765 [Pseudomonas syringae]|uniref:hypothetical protein n=1 Tax=Pseudomonas syringae TaxID=317 RepID=UPI00234C533B|nr:hypothetical protein [Pseudomonas syringae]MDC6536562.1 hypothetical protein [Pseudomonas syringae]